MKFTALLFSLTLSWFVQAQDNPKKMTLRDCLVFADQNSPLKQRSELMRKQSAAQRKLAKSEFLPQVNLYTDYRQFIDNTTYVFPEDEGLILSDGQSNGPYPVRLGQKFNLYAGASISQVLFDKRWLLASDFESLTNEMALLSDELLSEELIFGVSSLYYQVHKVDSKLELTGKTVERLNRLQELLRLQHENGVVKKSELDRLTLKIAQLEITTEQLQHNRNLLLERMKYLMGMSPEGSFDIAAEEKVVADLEAAEATSVQTRLSLKQEELSELSMKSVSGEYFPSVRAYGDFQFQAQRNSFNFFGSEDWFPQHYFGIGINFPILTGHEKKAKLDLEQIKLEELRMEREERQSQDDLEMQKLKNDLTIAGRYLDQRRNHKMLSERLYSEIALEYEEGITPLRELLIASSDQIEAANLYEEAYFEYKLAQINYLKAISGLENLLL